MLRSFALLALTAAVACTHGRSTDPPAATGSSSPHLTSFDGRVVLSWLEADPAGHRTLRFAFRESEAWGRPMVATNDSLLAVDTADIPSVVPLVGGGVAAHWTARRDGAPQVRDVMVSVSTDGGATWSTPVRPHRDTKEAKHGMASLLPADAAGRFGICWLDGRAGAVSEYGSGGTSLYWADWGGDGFGPEVLLDDRVCDCCKTSAARVSVGPIVAYRDRADDERRDIAVVLGSGATWTAPQPVHRDGWTINACPTNGPSIAAQGETAVVSWFTAADASPSVWVAASHDGGRTLATPVRVDGGTPLGRVEAAVLSDGSAAVVWLERARGGAEVRARRVAPDGTLHAPVVVATTSAARASGYPSIAAMTGHDVLVAWTEVGTATRVRASRVTLP